MGRGDQQVELSHLFFTDDILSFCQLDENMILNLKCVLLCFQAISRPNIHLNKSEMVKMGNRGDRDSLPVVLECQAVQLSIKYLGLPL